MERDNWPSPYIDHLNNWPSPYCQDLDQHLKTYSFPPCNRDIRIHSQLHSASWDTYMKDSKDFVAVTNLYDKKDLYFPGDQRDRHCLHTTLGNNLPPKSLLLTGYQPQEGIAGRGVRARCCNSETQSSSFWPPDEDTNPLGQQSSLMDISFSVFAVLALTKCARSQQILSKSSKLQLQFHYRMASLMRPLMISHDQRAGSKPLK